MEILPVPIVAFDFTSHQPYCCFTLRNSSTVDGRAFRLKVMSDPGSYSIKPNRGLLRPQESIAIVARMTSGKRKDILIRGRFECGDKFILESAVVDAGFIEEYDKPRMCADSIQQCRKSLLQDLWLEQTTQVVRQPLTARFDPPQPYEIKLKEGPAILSCFRSQKLRTYKPVLLHPMPLVAGRSETLVRKWYWPFLHSPKRVRLVNCSSNYMAYRFDFTGGDDSSQEGQQRLRIEPSEGILSPHSSIDLRVYAASLEDEEVLSTSENAQGEDFVQLMSTPVQDPALLETLMRGCKLSVSRMSRTYLDSRIWDQATRDDVWIESIPYHLDAQPQSRNQDRFFSGDETSPMHPRRSKPQRGWSSSSGRFGFLRQVGCLFCHWTRQAPMTPVHFE